MTFKDIHNGDILIDSGNMNYCLHSECKNYGKYPNRCTILKDVYEKPVRRKDGEVRGYRLCKFYEV